MVLFIVDPRPAAVLPLVIAMSPTTEVESCFDAWFGNPCPALQAAFIHTWTVHIVLLPVGCGGLERHA